MNKFGERIRQLRLEKKLPLRTVSAHLDIDQAILSKIERDQRKAIREQVINFATYFDVPKEELLVLWLSDKLVDSIKDEDMGLIALQLAEEKVTYHKRIKPDRNQIITKISEALSSFAAIQKAWIFGSFARKEEQLESDIDILIDVPTNKTFTLFDIAGIQDQLQTLLSRRVDVVMLSAIKPPFKERIEKEMKLIYEAG